MQMKILVVDDEKEIAQYITSLIVHTSPGSYVETYSSGTKALNSIEKRYFDLVVSDIVMPVTDGFDILSYIAKNSPSTEVVFMSAYRTFDYIYKANQIKPISYIVKTEDDETICRIFSSIIAKIETYQHERALIAQAEKLGISLREMGMADTTGVIQEEIEIIEKIKDYIESHIDRELSVSSIAQKFHYSASYLSRIFKDHTDINPSNYIMQYKMIQAKKLLKTTDVSIDTISKNLGYQTSQAFARAFKREEGLTPNDYRHMYIK